MPVCVVYFDHLLSCLHTPTLVKIHVLRHFHNKKFGFASFFFSDEKKTIVTRDRESTLKAGQNPKASEQVMAQLVPHWTQNKDFLWCV